jgi:hypothetical protein
VRSPEKLGYDVTHVHIIDPGRHGKGPDMSGLDMLQAIEAEFEDADRAAASTRAAGWLNR